MTEAWITIALLCVTTVAIKAAGPLVLGARTPSDRTLGVIALLAPALISSLVIYQTFADHPDGLVVDARLGGLIAAGGALAARLPMIVVVIVAAAATAALRAIT